jgi:transposase
MGRTALLELSKDELVALVLAQAAQIEALMRRVAALEAKLNEPPKTPDNSSKPPSQGQKADRRRPSQEERRQGRPGVARVLHPNPDRVVDAIVSHCPHCRADLAPSVQTPQQVYDRIELPPSKPDVTRVRLHGGRCAGCGGRFVADAPPGLEPGSPFGKSIEALVVYLHYAHAIGLERLAALMGEVFGLTISEGAISNILARARAPLGAAADAIAKRVKASRVVGSDETSARVDGQTWWEWVFVTSVAVLHIIRRSRGKAVPGDLFGDIRPPVWVSDMLGSQRGHGQAWQVCLAHLLRDAQYVVDCGDTDFGTAFKRLLRRAIAIGRRRADLKRSRRSGNTTAPTSTGGSPASWRWRPRARPEDGSASGSPASAIISSFLSPSATCRTPTTPPSAACAPASSSGRSPTGFAPSGAPRPMPPSDLLSAPPKPKGARSSTPSARRCGNHHAC